MERVDVIDENRDGAMPGRPRCLGGGDQVERDPIRAEADIKGRFAILEGNVETELVAGSRPRFPRRS
jgi:hypothetical protein